MAQYTDKFPFRKPSYHDRKKLPPEVDEVDKWGLRKEKMEYY